MEEYWETLIVADGSVVVANILDDETNKLADFLIECMVEGHISIIVPSIFFYEVTNSFLVAYRKKKNRSKRLAELSTEISKLSFSNR